MFSSRLNSKVACLAVVAVLGGFVLAGRALAGDHTVPNIKRMPQILWCRGCTPTSTSMILGYYDNWTSGTPYYTAHNVGKIVDYWRDLSYWSSGSGIKRNVPNTLLELVAAYHTDASGNTWTSNITPGLLYVTNTQNGCNFSSSYLTGSPSNSYLWGTITSQIGAGRPFIWSIGTPSKGHSLCAWGYTTGHYVIVYNTWNYGRDDWYYRKYDNGAFTTWQYINTVVPGGNPLDNCQLYLPTYSGNWLPIGWHFKIEWYQRGSLITKAAVCYSLDGGSHWHTIHWTKSRSGWNSYTWTIPSRPSSRVRVKVMGYYGTRYIAGDGIKYNLTISSH